MWVQAAGDLAAAAGSDALWVPGGMFLTGCELLRRAAIAFKEARQVDVDGARRKAAEAEAEAAELRKQRDEVKADGNTQIQDLKAEVATLRTEVGNLRGEHRTTMRDLELRHASELEAAHRRTEREIRVAYRIREWVAEKGLVIPDNILHADHALEEDR